MGFQKWNENKENVSLSRLRQAREAGNKVVGMIRWRFLDATNGSTIHGETLMAFFSCFCWSILETLMDHNSFFGIQGTVEQDFFGVIFWSKMYRVRIASRHAIKGFRKYNNFF